MTMGPDEKLGDFSQVNYLLKSFNAEGDVNECRQLNLDKVTLPSIIIFS